MAWPFAFVIDNYRPKSVCCTFNEKGMTVAKIIKFYIPNNFQKSVKWISSEQRGKIIEIASPVKKSA